MAVRLPRDVVTVRSDARFRVFEQRLEFVFRFRLSSLEFVFCLFDFEPLRDKFVSLTANNFASDVSLVSNAGGFQFVLSGNFNGKSFTCTDSLLGGTVSDTIHNNGQRVSINTDAGDDYLYSYADKVTIDAGEGDDYISNNGSNVLFNYRAGDGNDSINGFSATSTLSISGGTYETQKSGYYDVIVKVGDGAINLTGAASLDALNIATSILTLTNDDAAKITLDSDVDIADATARTKATRIMGNALNNSILGGTGKDTLYGQSGDDYINGGKGNDSLSGGDGDDTISGSAGNDVITGGAGNNSLSGGDGADRIYGGSGKDTILGGKGNDSLTGNDGNDVISGNDGNDTLKGGAGNDTLTGGAGNDLFVYSAGNDIITDYATGDKISLGAAVGNATLKGSDAVLTIGKGSLTVKNTKQLTLIDKAGKELTTVIGGVVYDDSAADKVTVPSGIDIVDASSRSTAIKIVVNKIANSIVGGAGNDTISAGNGNDTIYGGAGNDSISGGNDNDYLSGDAGNDKLLGGAGNDSLWGDAGNDTLTGGDGADLFVYSSGKDIIADYAAGDKISLGAEVSEASLNGVDSVLKFIHGGTLTIKKAKALTLINSSGSELTTIIGGLILDNTAGATTLDSGIAFVDATARTKGIKITGNALDNSILGGAGADNLYGQNSNDTLWGGAGNDTLTGGKGADVFIYNSGEGKDVVADFSNDDLLQITGTFSAAYDSSANTISFKVGSTAGAITLKDYTATTFNLNGDSYLISGSKLIKK